MKIHCLAALLLAAPLAWGQTVTPTAHQTAPRATPPEANPDAVVPRVAYRSAFKDTPTGVQAQAVDWKKANAEVGQFRRGHVDVLKWEQHHGSKP